MNNENKISLTEIETFKSIEIPKIFDKVYNKKYNKLYFIPNKIKSQNQNIRNLLISSIDKNLMFEKPETLKNFETSLKTFFFGKNGKFTKYIPNLNKEIKLKEFINLKEKKSNNNLNRKIKSNELINNINEIKKDNFNNDLNKKKDKKFFSRFRIYHSISPPSKLLFSDYIKNNDENKKKKKDVKFFISSLNNNSYSLYQKQVSNMNSISYNNNTFYHQKNNFSDNIRQNSFFSNNNSSYNDLTNLTNYSTTIKNNSTHKKKSFYKNLLIKRNLEKNKTNFLNNMKKSKINLKNKLDIIYNNEQLLSNNILNIINNNKISEKQNKVLSFDNNINNLYNFRELNNDLNPDDDLTKLNEKKKIISTIKKNIDDKEILKIVKRKDLQIGTNFDEHIIIKLKRYLILKEQMNNYKVNKRINNNLIDMKKIAYKIEQIKDKIKKKEEDKKIKTLMKQIKNIK